MKTHYLKKTLAAAIASLALLVDQGTAADLTLASSGSAVGTITVNTTDSLTIAVGSSATRILTNAITLGGGTLKSGVMDNVATVSGLTGTGTSSTFVDANGVTIILRGSGTANTTANLTLASGVTITGANQLLVGGGGGGGGGRSSRTDGGGGGGGNVVLTTGNLSGTTTLTAGGGGTAGFTTSTTGSGAGGAGNTTSIGATTASGGGGAAPSGGTPTGKGGNSGRTISGTTTTFTGGDGFTATTSNAGGGGGAGSSANGAKGVSTGTGGAGGAGTQITTGVVGLSTYLGSNTFGGGGGGGGGGDTTAGAGGAGGAGGGGAGATNTLNMAGAAGTDGLGGGGGGGANGTNGPGGAGGAGSVAIQYAYNSNVAAGSLTLSGGITLDSTSTLDAVRSGGLIDVTSAITGVGGLNIASSVSSGGVVRLSAANTYSGNTQINAGTLEAGHASAFGSGAITLASGATLNLNNFQIANTITNNGGTILGAASFTGTATVSAGTGTFVNIGGTVDIDNAAVADLSGDIDAQVNVRNGGRGRALGQIKKDVSVAGGAHFDITNDTTIDAGAFSFANNGQINIDRASNDLTISKVISGTGTLLKSGASKLVLEAANTLSGLTRVQGGQLKVNGSVAGNVQVDSGAELGGSGVIAGGLLGDGQIGPGNSPGILTVEGSVTPSANTSFAFELSGIGSPVWSSASASLNDVLRLTAADPFTSALASTNIVKIYFERASLSEADTFLGGFFIDNPNQTAGLLASELGGAVFQYFVLGDGLSTGNMYNGKNYYTLADYNASLSVGRSIVNVSSANFADGTVTTGQVTQFVIVPEPGALALAGGGIALVCWTAARRRCRSAR